MPPRACLESRSSISCDRLTPVPRRAAALKLATRCGWPPLGDQEDRVPQEGWSFWSIGHRRQTARSLLAASAMNGMLS